MEYELINKTNFQEIRKDISLKKNKKIVVEARDNDLNRKILEDSRASCLLFNEFYNNASKLKQRDSGLNHVLCKIAKKNNVTIAFSFNIFLKKDSFSLADSISKLSQNIRLCQKYKVNIIFKDVKDIDKLALKSFLLTLGMNNLSVKKCVENSFD